MEMKRLALFAVLMLTACTTVKYVPVKEIERVEVRDTTYLHKTDTLVKVREFNLSDYTGLQDTLTLRTDLAESKAWVDADMMALKGRLVQTGSIPVQIVERERVVYKDSIRDREVPVPVVEEKIVKTVPFFWRLFAFIGIVATAGLVFWLLRKFKVL